MPAAGLLERLLRRDRALTLVGLFALCALTWIYIVAGAGLGMSTGEMTTLTLFPHAPPTTIPAMAMPGMAMPAAGPPVGHPGYWALLVAMWFAMMIAMMVPSAAPTILLYARVQRHAEAQGRLPATRLAGAHFAGGYLLAWLAFSVVAAGLQLLLQRADILSAATMGSQVRWLSGAVLLAAGAYQLSPLKNACLSRCRSPAAFLSRNWRPGPLGALRLGLLHGVYCIGCCWMLMALLFVGGVMNLIWIGGLTLLVVVEKLSPGGRWIGRVTGIALLAWGLLILLK